MYCMMQPLTLLYLHGFNSAHTSHKAQVLQAHLDRLGRGAQLLAPDLPHRPAQAMALVESLLAQMPSKPTLVGSSLGGYYATYLAERHDLRAVLINPAVAPYRLLSPLLGPQRNFYTGETYELTARHLAELQALEVETLHPERYFLLVQTGDEVLDYREAVTRYVGANQCVIAGGDHGFQQFENYLDAILAFAGMGTT
jgi:predicted esterase YcpF (UPF0227 family)